MRAHRVVAVESGKVWCWEAPEGEPNPAPRHKVRVALAELLERGSAWAYFGHVRRKLYLREPKPAKRRRGRSRRWESATDETRAGFRELAERFDALAVAPQAFAALGLPYSPEVTPDEIGRAFRQKAKHAHPDAGGDAAEFAELCRARDLALKVAHRKAVARG